MPVEMKIATCSVCGKDAALMCQRCAEPYCNDGCQRSDWQRHKYFCIVMPPLVNVNLDFLKTKSKLIAETKQEKSIVKAKESPLAPTVLSKKWRDHIKLREGNEFFECRVTHVDESGIIWVIDVANLETVEHFTEKMIEAMSKRKPCVRIEELSIDGLVGVTVNKKVFRGKVMELHPKRKEADICLIDYGAVLTTGLDNIYLPLSPMADANAFAFRVKLPNAEGEVVQANKNLTIRLLGTKTYDGIYHVQLKPKLAIPLNLPVKLLQANPNVEIVHILQPNTILLQMKALNSLNDDLNEALKDNTAIQFTEPFPKSPSTFFVAAQNDEGYRRAFLLDFYEKPKPRYLVYEMDEGRVTITDKLRRIPSDLVAHPMRVFAVTLTTDSLKDLLSQSDNLSVQIQPESGATRSASITLLSNGQEICEGRARTFNGKLSDIGSKFWEEPLTTGQSVFITRVISHGELYVSSVETKNYAKILRELEGKCKPFADPKNIAIGCIALVLCPTQGHFRGEVTESKGNGNYIVRNIDSGHEHAVSGDILRTSCRFIDTLPVTLTRIKLKTISEIPIVAVPANNDACHMLKALCAEAKEWTIQFSDSTNEIASLLAADDQISLVNRLLPLIFTPHKKTEVIDIPSASEVKEDTKYPSLPPSPISSLKSLKLDKRPIPETKTSSVERFYFKDMKIKMIAFGKSVEIMLLNSVGVHKTGFVTACHFSDDQEIEVFQKILDTVELYGQDKKTKVPGYVPEVGELCTSLFKDDMRWYRGVCLEVCGDKVKILYCDFGNVDEVPLDYIKPIPGNLVKFGYSTKCYINGFGKDKDFSVVEEYLVKQAKLTCDVEEGPKPNTRSLTILNLEKILSQEMV
ncbi:uncharacterized protein Dwil_GK22481 [Drosophila willistoni]|uniref:Tudor domain-containing protein n=1 Tax=Drosophila willistoni TaxID=7260 RepID=B4NFQ3_DROWI|nr:uncharacterized protein LOC6649476 [Drosophila willistoni]EDW83120.2 uncharacterized protein Dwil_GK22481 [Drosophila willistoni]